MGEIIRHAVHTGRAAVLVGCPHHHRVAADGHRTAEEVAPAHVARLQERLLRDGIDRDRVPGPGRLHVQPQVPAARCLEPRLHVPPVRIPRPQPSVVHHRRAFPVPEPHPQRVLHHLRLQRPPRTQPQPHRPGLPVRAPDRRPVQREPMLQAPRVVHPPFLKRAIPSQGQALASGRRHRGHAPHGLLPVARPIAGQLQPPRPCPLPRMRHEAAPVEPRRPFLPRVARLPAPLHRKERMPPRIVRGLDAVPLGAGKSCRHLAGLDRPPRLQRRAEGRRAHGQHQRRRPSCKG